MQVNRPPRRQAFEPAAGRAASGAVRDGRGERAAEDGGRAVRDGGQSGAECVISEKYRSKNQRVHAGKGGAPPPIPDHHSKTPGRRAAATRQERTASVGDHFPHALVGKMTNTFWKSRTHAKNDRPCPLNHALGREMAISDGSPSSRRRNRACGPHATLPSARTPP